MKAKLNCLITALALLALATLNSQLATARAQGTAFTYQGRLNTNGIPAKGTYNLKFTLFNTNTTGISIAGPVTNSAAVATNGLFTTTIDFGAGVFTGGSNWLEIAVRTNGNGTFNTLTPRQLLTPTPYAIYAESANDLSVPLSASQLTSIGNNNGGYGNFFIGLSGNPTMSGYANTANGLDALNQNTTGFQNTANGGDALTDNTSGSQNTANGFAALYSNTTGSQNTANGWEALYFNWTASGNTANGFEALYKNITGSYNTANGDSALVQNTTGSQNTADGVSALQSNTNGNNNTALGCSALYQNRSGSGNITIGVNAGSAIVTGGNNIDIGNTGYGDESDTIRIGTTQTKAVMLGIFGTTVGGGAPVQVNASGLLGTVTSSRRFKQNIHSMADASDVLLALHPVTFQYKSELDPEGTPQFGLIAEDVEKVDPALVLHDDKKQIYTVRYDSVNAMLLNEFLKEHRTVQEQGSEIQSLKQQLDKLEQLINQQEGSAK